MKSSRSGRPFLFSIALAAHLLAFAAFNAQAQSGEAEIDPGDSGSAAGIPPYVEYRKRIESTQNIAPLDNGLFGESVSLYNGSTDFTVTDIDLPGNNGLPVQLSRRFSVELQPESAIGEYDDLLRGVGNWDIDVPYLAATYPQGSGWNADRCSMGSVPLLTIGRFNRAEVWQGIAVHVPGEGDRSMLGMDTPVPRPSDGAQYRGTTAERDVFDCIAMQSGLTGEGFRMTTVSGLRYYFDIGTIRTAAPLAKWEVVTDFFENVTERLTTLDRSRFYLLASKIEDRFGNTVQFQYNSSGHPTRIWSSDGREVLLSYVGGRLATATSHGRTWQYQYNQAGVLIAVTLPDASKWLYAYSDNLRPPSPSPLEPGAMPYCLGSPLGSDASLTLTATHPGGAVGTFVFSNRRHWRSGVHANECVLSDSNADYEPEFTLLTPHFFDVMSLNSKSISGPGLTTAMAWTYDYGSNFQVLWGTYSEQGFYPCTTCTTEKPVTVTNPDGSKTRYRYGVLYMVNDGRLLGTETLSASGTVVRSETNDYLTEVDAPNQAFYGQYGHVLGNVADPSTVRIRPIVKRTITQQSRSFKWQVSATCGANGTTLCFDTMARPTKVIKTSEAAP